LSAVEDVHALPPREPGEVRRRFGARPGDEVGGAGEVLQAGGCRQNPPAPVTENDGNRPPAMVDRKGRKKFENVPSPASTNEKFSATIARDRAY
jgi:hypothetical protein